MLTLYDHKDPATHGGFMPERMEVGDNEFRVKQHPAGAHSHHVDIMSVMQILLCQAQPPKGWDGERSSWSIHKFEMNVDQIVVHLVDYDYMTEESTVYKAVLATKLIHCAEAKTKGEDDVRQAETIVREDPRANSGCAD